MPTLALDLAEACLLTAEKEATGLFHISGKDMMTVYELVTHVAKYWDLNLNTIQAITSAELSQDAKRPRKTGFILAKAIRVLGYEPHSFMEGLRIVDNQLSARN
jgi:dTDP-4-dehydrorhamnose reductase